MKKIFLFIVLFQTYSCSKDNSSNISEDSNCENKHFYYFNETKIRLDSILLQNKLEVGFQNTKTNSEIVDFINNNQDFEKIDVSKVREYSKEDIKVVIIKLKNNKTCIDKTTIIKKLLLSDFVVFANQTYMGGLWFGGQSYNVMSINNTFVVQVFDTSNITDLNKIVAETNTEIVERNKFMPDFYIIKTTKKSIGNSLEMANYFAEKKLFKCSEPNFSDYIDP